MEKTIYDLTLHEVLKVKNGTNGDTEITRVPNGWIYAFDYPGYHQSPLVFVPYHTEFVLALTKKTNGNKKES
jgi:hypothetical protein